MIVKEIKCFNDVVEQLCNVRKCFLVEHTGNMYTIRSSHPTLADDVAYFSAVCDCYMATMYGSTAWIDAVDFTENTITLGINA